MALDSTHYCSLADLDAEGLTNAVLGDDTRREELVRDASRAVDKFCRQWFYDREYGSGSEFYVSGKNRSIIHLPAPIISVERVEVDWNGLGVWDVVDPSTYVLFGDDRDWQNPKIVRTQGGSNPLTGDLSATWPKGVKNIRVQCHLGCLVLDAPLSIKRATMRIVNHDAELIGSRYATEERRAAMGQVQSERTRDRSVSYAETLSIGGLTGDSFVDGKLQLWRRTFI